MRAVSWRMALTPLLVGLWLASAFAGPALAQEDGKFVDLNDPNEQAKGNRPFALGPRCEGANLTAKGARQRLCVATSTGYFWREYSFDVYTCPAGARPPRYRVVTGFRTTNQRCGKAAFDQTVADAKIFEETWFQNARQLAGDPPAIPNENTSKEIKARPVRQTLAPANPLDPSLLQPIPLAPDPSRAQVTFDVSGVLSVARLDIDPGAFIPIRERFGSEGLGIGGTFQYDLLRHGENGPGAPGISVGSSFTWFLDRDTKLPVACGFAQGATRYDPNWSATPYVGFPIGVSEVMHPLVAPMLGHTSASFVLTPLIGATVQETRVRTVQTCCGGATAAESVFSASLTRVGPTLGANLDAVFPSGFMIGIGGRVTFFGAEEARGFAQLTPNIRVPAGMVALPAVARIGEDTEWIGHVRTGFRF